MKQWSDLKSLAQIIRQEASRATSEAIRLGTPSDVRLHAKRKR
jgi:hypothetical protein